MTIEARSAERSIPIFTGLRNLFSKSHYGVDNSAKDDYKQSTLWDSLTLQRMGISNNVTRRGYLSRIGEDFIVARIYYPGVGEDLQLEEVFERGKIFYLDSLTNGDYYFEDIYDAKTHHFVQADMTKSPFLDGVFDAVFIQDIHATDRMLIDIINTLRPNGVLIYSFDDCAEGNLKDIGRLQTHPHLERLEMPYHHYLFTAFRKREVVISSNEEQSKDNKLVQGKLL